MSSERSYRSRIGIESQELDRRSMSLVTRRAPEPGLSLVSVIRLSSLLISLALATGLSACGRRGPLEPPPGEAAVSTKKAAQAQNSVETPPPRGNTFFNPSVTPEPVPQDDIDPGNQPINPQLGVGGAVTTPTRQSARASQPGIAPVGGGSKAKRILPKQDGFILDPLL